MIKQKHVEKIRLTQLVICLLKNKRNIYINHSSHNLGIRNITNSKFKNLGKFYGIIVSLLNND